MNYYAHHIGDYAAATAHLSWDEDMAYTRLIRAYYQHEKPLPTEVRDVCRLVRASSAAQRKAVETVLREFFTKGPDGWHQRRCDEEIARYYDKRTKAQGSANARWHGVKTDSDGNANASGGDMRTHSEGTTDDDATALRSQSEGNAPNPNPNPNPITNSKNKKGESARASRLPPDWPLTPQRRSIAEAAGVNVEVTYANFTDHWRAAGGQNSRKVDWDAAWRFWCRKDGQKQNGSHNPARPSTAWDRVMEANRDD